LKPIKVGGNGRGVEGQEQREGENFERAYVPQNLNSVKKGDTVQRSNTQGSPFRGDESLIQEAA